MERLRHQNCEDFSSDERPFLLAWLGTAVSLLVGLRDNTCSCLARRLAGRRTWATDTFAFSVEFHFKANQDQLPGAEGRIIISLGVIISFEV
jgi:hypothetical protein